MTVDLRLGDCLQVLRELPDFSVQCCVTSPPYYGLRDYGIDGQIGLEPSPEEYIARLVAVFREVRRVLKDDGTLWLNLGDSYWTDSAPRKKSSETFSETWNPANSAGNGGLRRTAAKHGDWKNKDLLMIPARVALALQADGWYLRSEIIWHKPNPMPESVRDRPTKAHEMIYLLAKSQKYYYDAEAVREPALNNSGFARQRENGVKEYSDKFGDFTGHETKAGLSKVDNKPTRNRRDVWTVTTKPYKEAHFATFPMDLIEPCILAGSRVGDTVLDPFNGSGTTGAVSVMHGRRYIGIELNPAYIELSQKRIDGTQMEIPA